MTMPFDASRLICSLEAAAAGLPDGLEFVRACTQCCSIGECDTGGLGTVGNAVLPVCEACIDEGSNCEGLIAERLTREVGGDMGD